MKLIHMQWPCSCWDGVLRTEDGKFTFIRMVENGKSLWCCKDGNDSIVLGWGATVREAMVAWQENMLKELQRIMESVSATKIPAEDEQIEIMEFGHDKTVGTL